jgi:hypothetical protein
VSDVREEEEEDKKSKPSGDVMFWRLTCGILVC